MGKRLHVKVYLDEKWLEAIDRERSKKWIDMDRGEFLRWCVLKQLPKSKAEQLPVIARGRKSV